VRLNRFLAQAGVAARRKCDDLIRTGQVGVNGIPVTEPWHDVDPLTDLVTVDGNPIEAPEGHSYLLVNKPPAVITTVEDPQGRRTVLDLLGNALGGRRLYPVGRLDADTTGALLLTDDGELAFRLTHPRYGAPKEYVARLDREVSDRDISRLERGVDLDDGPARPDLVRRAATDELEIHLHVGRKRIVKRMIESIGYRVDSLHRRRFAGISADDLPRGGWRELSLEETNRLREQVSLDPIG
jgi:23S rRNA pseudouridine2605 synthase